MAEEVVVKDPLSREMIDAGRELTILLEDHQIEISAALWLYLSEPNVWRLTIASPMVGTSGPKGLYEKIQSLIQESPEKLGEITLLNISAVEPENSVISALGRVLKLKEIGGVRFSRNTIYGIYVEDSYIYKMT